MSNQISITRRSSITTTLFGQPGTRKFSQDLLEINPYSNNDSNDDEKEKETLKVLFFQVFIPFLIAGFSNVVIGIILDKVQSWPVFVSIPELFLLIASFMGFKGNLEMTLAARLATQANTGQMDSRKEQISIAFGNIALIQSQSIIVGFLSALIAIMVNYWKESSLNVDSFILIITTALITASISGLLLTILMVVVTIISRKCGLNPDNVSTLFAAVFGDSTAGLLLAYTAQCIHDFRHLTWVAPSISLIFIPILVCCIVYARMNTYTKDVIIQGWIPIIIAMIISSIAGFIFDISIAKFDNIALFLPIINGVGSNLVAVQTSRISTYFHQRYELGTISDKVKTCSSPLSAFIGSSKYITLSRNTYFELI